jgi:ubiquinone/menaquinone biosynthesis C-methylase UbiE/catechol 2,3-dioxygenase-like lactoylglutathione lyase family enzyme
MPPEDRTMSTLTSRERFLSHYEGQPPWDIPRAQPALAAAADHITGSVLDAGCGTGENALFLAQQGRQVTGIDFVEQAISRARRKAIERRVWVTFLERDALTLARWDERFDSVTDSGLFHVFSDAERKRYVEGLATVLKPGGRLFLMCFSDEEPGTDGPRRVSRRELEEAFARGWQIESIRPMRFETRPDLKDVTFSEGGPKAWFATVRRSPGPAVEAVVETALYADDLDAAAAFYSNVLGLTLIDKEAGRHVFFRVGGGDVLLIFKAETTLRGDTLPAHGAKGPGHFALGIDAGDYEAWRRRLTDAGVAIEREVTWPPGGRSFYFRDPAGNAAELVTPGVWGTAAGW